MSKVEEVTRALATDQMRRTLAAAGLEYEPGQDAFLRGFAIAAIKAMREPTKQMLSGVRPQEYTIEHYHGSGHHRSFPTLGSGPVQVWQDMIDAALREEGR